MSRKLPPLKKPQKEKLKPLSGNSTLSSMKLSRNKLVGLSVGIVLIIGGAIAFGIREHSRNSEADQARDGLSLAVDAVEATDRTQRAAGLASKGNYLASARLAEQASNDLSTLRERASAEEGSSEVLRSVSSAAKVSRQVESSAKALLAARRAERGDDPVILRQAKRDLEKSSRANERLTAQVDRVKRQFSREIAGFTAQLEELGSLGARTKGDAEESARRAAQPTPAGLAQGIIRRSESELALIGKRLDWVEPRPGPRSCGKTPEGGEVLVNEGKVSCRDAFFVAGNSRGPNESFAPRGWDCSAFASDLDGRTILGAAGYSCIRSDSARITINNEGVGAASASSSGTSACNAPSGVTNLVTTGASNCDEAFGVSAKWAELYGQNPDLAPGPTNIPIEDGEDPVFLCDPEAGGLVTCIYRSSSLDGGVEDPGRTISFAFVG